MALGTAPLLLSADMSSRLTYLVTWADKTCVSCRETQVEHTSVKDIGPDTHLEAVSYRAAMACWLCGTPHMLLMLTSVLTCSILPSPSVCTPALRADG